MRGLAVQYIPRDSPNALPDCKSSGVGMCISNAVILLGVRRGTAVKALPPVSQSLLLCACGWQATGSVAAISQGTLVTGTATATTDSSVASRRSRSVVTRLGSGSQRLAIMLPS